MFNEATPPFGALVVLLLEKYIYGGCHKNKQAKV
jgi:hypothetical protein